jgi:phosphopantothenoylcysteine decarboxylase/phosphopantothenate--cysteine ligase
MTEIAPEIKWCLTPPTESELNDHAVNQYGNYLKNKTIAFMITGSVAAMKSPLIIRALRRYGADVTVFVSQEGLRYVTSDVLRWSSNKPIIDKLSPKSEHLHDGKPYDIYLLAPATYNTINKVAHGVADSLITTTLASALGFMCNPSEYKTSILIAPAMHGSLHNPILTESILRLHRVGVQFIKPRQEVGKNNLASKDIIVAATCRAASTSVLSHKENQPAILVTAGPTPVKIDSIRRITNKFSGKLGILIAQDLYLRGASVFLMQANSGMRPPKWLPHVLYDDYDDYRQKVLDAVSFYEYGIFSAAVADYTPAEAVDGKIASGGQLTEIKLVETEKIIDLVQKKNPNLRLVSFKYEHSKELHELVALVKSRLQSKRHFAIVANSNNLAGPKGEHKAFIFKGERDPLPCTGKLNIASGISQLLEEDYALHLQQ